MLDCVATALGDTAPARRCVVRGPAVHEHCCDDGQLTVAMIGDWESARFPEPAEAVFDCGQATRTLQLEVTLLRCSQQLDSHGNPPSCEVQALEAHAAAVDAQRIRKAVLCCFDEGVVVGAGVWTLEAGCGGYALTAYVDVGPVCCG